MIFILEQLVTRQARKGELFKLYFQFLKLYLLIFKPNQQKHTLARNGFIPAAAVPVEEVSNPAPVCLLLPLHANHQTSHLPALMPSKALPPASLKISQVIEIP